MLRKPKWVLDRRLIIKGTPATQNVWCWPRKANGNQAAISQFMDAGTVYGDETAERHWRVMDPSLGFMNTRHCNVLDLMRCKSGHYNRSSSTVSWRRLGGATTSGAVLGMERRLVRTKWDQWRLN
ncbi:PREDICTED: uncharacterized protein LOC101299356 [Fragaria vesca subsp. vesca]